MTIVSKLEEKDEERKLFLLECNKTFNFIEQAVKDQSAIHQVEQGIFQMMLKIGWHALSSFIKFSGNGDVGETAKIDERKLKRLSIDNKKEYLSVFGLHEVKRAVYAADKGKKIELCPLDEKLLLPESKFSYLLQDWNQSIAIEQPYNKVNDVLNKILGLTQSTNSSSRITRKLSIKGESFWDQLKAPDFSESKPDNLIFVYSADGKGVPIIEETYQAELFQGELKKSDPSRNGKKKMSLVGSAYSISPFVRTPENILEALFSNATTKDNVIPMRPKPLHKYIRASLLRNEAGASTPSYNEIFNWLGKQNKQRNPEGSQPVVLLMDGQKSLWEYAEKTIQSSNRIEILDLLHACAYIWDAANAFHGKGSDVAKDFAKKRIGWMLSGKIERVIAEFQLKENHGNLSKKKRDTVKKICGYLKNNKHRMRYHEYLAAGYPIASGIIEGACRHVIKDRMELTGMRWIMAGAHAMMGIRSVSASGLWDEYMTFFIKQESKKLYPGKAENDDLYSFALAA